MRQLAPLYLVIFVSFCGYAMMVTLFVPMIMGGNGFVDEATPFATRSLLVGLLLAAYPFGQFFGSPFIGVISDRYGRRPVLIGSLTIALAAYCLVALGIEVRTLLLIALACLAGGFAESNIAVAQSAIADVAPPDRRPQLFGWIYSCCSLGYIAGPLLGGQVASRLGWSAPFWFLLPATRGDPDMGLG